MTKRIVSGVFLLIALGALGLILAGALTSGEQLIVRFLTAIIVAALGLYVISDLRLQADDTAVANSTTRATAGGSARAITTEPPPPNSTAAFMATVTGKRSATTASLDDRQWEPGFEGSDESRQEHERAAQASTVALAERSADEPDGSDEDGVEGGDLVDGRELSATGTDAGTLVSLEADEGSDAVAAPSGVTLEAAGDSGRGLHAVPPLGMVESPYSQDALEVGQWPLTPDGQAVAETDMEQRSDEAEIDGLVAIFTKQAERKLDEQPALAVNGHRQPVFVGTDATAGSSAFALRGVAPLPIEGELQQPLAGLVSGSAAGANAGSDTTDRVDSIDTAGDRPGSSASAPAPAAGTSGPVDTAAATPVSTMAADQAPVASAAALPADRAEAEAAVGLVAASYAGARIIDLRFSRDDGEEIEAAIRSGELEVITSLIDQGILSTEGPISDRDVRTMVYVAFTSNELRKILLAGGTLDGDNSALDLGPVEVFTDVDPNELPAHDLAQLEPAPPQSADD